MKTCLPTTLIYFDGIGQPIQYKTITHNCAAYSPEHGDGQSTCVYMLWTSSHGQKLWKIVTRSQDVSHFAIYNQTDMKYRRWTQPHCPYNHTFHHTTISGQHYYRWEEGPAIGAKSEWLHCARCHFRHTFTYLSTSFRRIVGYKQRCLLVCWSKKKWCVILTHWIHIGVCDYFCLS